jgi:hypothetical protein
MIDGKEVYDTGNKILGHRLFEEKDGDDSDLRLYVVTDDGRVDSIIIASADCNQNVGFISDWRIEKA